MVITLYMDVGAVERVDEVRDGGDIDRATLCCMQFKLHISLAEF